MKIDLTSLERTKLSCPSEWKGSDEFGIEVTITYRTGRIKIFLEDKLKIETSKDDLDIGSYMEDVELYDILVRDGLADPIEKEEN